MRLLYFALKKRLMEQAPFLVSNEAGERPRLPLP